MGKEGPCVQHTSKFQQVGLFAAGTWKEGFQVLNLADK